ncbi:MAG: hypothetical protein P0Y53_24485 [Candidatus Pseudobacter hemicellulosilyticus]|uniref:Uncharacterized protein n=1 Tax=Candidatus Pseudobacter hemicellulosilyticus TaxID=3121375 RepID=A0AAJ5WRI0_9BACT|nr:MAG: hypothetical protein P0Y53_24485 [Pseudobacter sp.]
MRTFFLPGGLLALMAGLFCYSCTKYDDRLDTQQTESGIIGVMKDGQVVDEAFIDETVTVYAKIGEADADLKCYVSDQEASILTRGSRISHINPANAAPAALRVDTFNIVVPRTAKIGAGNVYFSVNGAIKPALPFLVKRPDILIPNQVWVEPFLSSYSDSTERGDSWNWTFPEMLRDGRSREAVVNTIRQLCYDANGQAFYFLDIQRADGVMFIRQYKDGVVTTIAGAGNDYMASNAANLKLGTEYFSETDGRLFDMKTGPDGKLYFTNLFRAPDPVTGKTGVYSLIQRIDPATGKVEKVLGGERLLIANPSRTANNYRGIMDGRKDTAMIQFPSSLTFDKAGNLYFLERVSYYENGTLLRRLTTNGKVETLLGKVDIYLSETIDPSDGKSYFRPYYYQIYEDSDGFGDEVRFTGLENMVLAGNGKIYLQKYGKIIEVNPDTKEASSIIGLPDGMRGPATGTFKEVELATITTFDVDFDGNILFGHTSVFKMDLQAETVAMMTSFTAIPPEYNSPRQFVQQRQPGTNCVLGRMNRIVFDQFGTLYAGYIDIASSSEVRIARIIIER